MGIDGHIFEVSHELRGNGIDACETDIAVVSYGTRPRLHTHVLIGECKGLGRIEEDDIRKLSLVANRMRESGVTCDLVFSTTRESFTNDEMALLSRYYTDQDVDPRLRRAPILLTRAELDTYHVRSHQGRQDYYMEGFGGLVRQSKERYFEPPNAQGPQPA